MKHNSQGGVQVPTGGDVAKSKQARERLSHDRASRPGWNPGPTVIVRTKENSAVCRRRSPALPFFRFTPPRL